MNGEQLLDQLGLTEDSLVAEAAQARRKRPIWFRCLEMAAVLFLVFLVGSEMHLHFGSANSKVALTTGQWTSEAFYYMSDGVWSYIPGETAKQVLRAGHFDWWAANDYGLYYTTGRRLYVRVWETGETEQLYRASFWCDKLDFRTYLRDDGKVEVMPVSRFSGKGSTRILDGKTGDVYDCIPECLSAEDYLAQAAVNNDEFMNVLLLSDGRYCLAFEEGRVMCRETGKDERWELALDTSGVRLEKGLTNGRYLITGVDWHAPELCWEIVYDAARRPVELRLVEWIVKE